MSCTSRALSFLLLSTFSLACHRTESPRAAPARAAAPGAKIVAAYDGRQISRAEVEAATDSDESLPIYDRRANALTGLIVEDLAHREAKRSGLTDDAYYAREVTAKIVPTSDAELKDIYTQAEREGTLEPGKTFDDFRVRLRRTRLDIQEIELREQLADRLMRAAHVRMNLDALGLTRLHLEEDGLHPSRGAATPSVEVVEFASLADPHAAMGHEVLEQLLAKYPKDVRIVFRPKAEDDQPLSRAVGKAALCAGEQGRYWEFRVLALADQTHLADADLASKAKRVGVDLAKFSACVASERVERLVTDDTALAKGHGLTGDPEFLVNGVRLSGAAPIESFERLIEIDKNRLPES